ncbi:hypothetical protein [Algoriphagus vanfongensis]|uniref:hypothetical protein n=1 Tax=Algoriphagus vanfongensis TaxID=426371 RepID=UPI00042596A2|nr:hypothetical protein [Algoriphagus vanfongensis]
MKRSLILLFFLGILYSCENKSNTSAENVVEEVEIEQSPNIEVSLVGSYADDSYSQRSEGYDWVGVRVKQTGENQISISVRSRADKKRPTCTFDTQATKRKEGLYVANLNGKEIIFEFTETSLTIKPQDEADAGLLNFYCGGGATVAGTYQIIEGELDPDQVDPTTFSSVLNLQGVGFNVSAVKKDGKNTLSIFTFGLESQEFREDFDLGKYEITNAEVEDLNSDGSPELLIYSKTSSEKSVGQVLAFSVNNKKSMSQVYFPPTSENSEINEGYWGFDEFSVVETYLVQRFPIYKEGDVLGKPSGGMRQVSYKLVDGEAMRSFQVHSVSEF